MTYPKFKYHADLEPCIVLDEAEESSLGEGWEDSPAAHGVITNPSAEQTRKMQMESLTKEPKRGRPKKEE